MNELEFSFIQQALNKVNEKSQLYRKVKAIIWITKGDHFWFQCRKTLTKEQVKEKEYKLETPFQYDRICAV